MGDRAYAQVLCRAKDVAAFEEIAKGHNCGWHPRPVEPVVKRGNDQHCEEQNGRNRLDDLLAFLPLRERTAPHTHESLAEAFATKTTCALGDDDARLTQYSPRFIALPWNGVER